MPFLNFDEFCNLKESNRALLAIDHGTKRIGLAKSDAGWFLSSPYEVLKNSKFTFVCEQLEEIIRKNQICGLVIGLPLEIEGGENKKCQSIRQFGRNLDKILNIPIYFQDERFSSIDAEEVLQNFDISFDRRKSKIDKIAASQILQTFLNKINI